MWPKLSLIRYPVAEQDRYIRCGIGGILVGTSYGPGGSFCIECYAGWLVLCFDICVNRWLSLCRFITLLEMAGPPLSFHKFRGGFQMDFVGFWVDCTRFEIGMSEKRVAWLVKFVEELISNEWLVHMRRLQDIHGRLGFAAQVLPWIKPMLAPGYSWISAAGRTATLKMPQLVAAACIFIRDKFGMGYRKLPCGVKESFLGELFRTDAKCEKDRIVLGGWLLNERGDSTCGAWFSLSLGVGETPWLFRDDGESSWASTSAELLASLVALKILPLGSIVSGTMSSHLLHCGGGTDNKAAGSLSVRKLSTKLPVLVVLMEYLSQCESMNIRCKLNWRPRDTNVEADDLTNETFDRFDMKLRIPIKWEDLAFPILERMIGFTQSFIKSKAEHQLERPSKEARFEKSKWGWSPSVPIRVIFCRAWIFYIHGHWLNQCSNQTSWLPNKIFGNMALIQL